MAIIEVTENKIVTPDLNSACRDIQVVTKYLEFWYKINNSLKSQGQM